MLDTKIDHRMDARERDGLSRDGFVVREGVFSPAECARILRMAGRNAEADAQVQRAGQTLALRRLR